MKYLGMQIMVEGLALAAFGFIHQLSTRAAHPRHHASHHAGRGAPRRLRRPVAEGHVRGHERVASSRDREDFIVESSRLMRDRFLGEEVWEHMGMPVEECLDLALHSESMQHLPHHALLEDRAQREAPRPAHAARATGFEELDVIQFESWDASA